MPDTTIPTDAEVELILDAEKRITGDIEWVQARDRWWLEFRTRVESDERWPLTLVGKARLLPPFKRSYSLILHRDARGFRIFSLDVNGNHRNFVINREYWHNRTHKQRWMDYCGDAFAFTPEELVPEEPNAAFLEFCRECKITFSGHIGDFPAGRR